MGQQTNIFTPFFAMDMKRDNSVVPADGMPIVPLFIGQKLPTGAAANATINEVVSIEDVIALAGEGSHLHATMAAYYQLRGMTTVKIGVLEEAAGATAGTQVATVSLSTQDAGTVNYRVNGFKFSTPISSTDTPTSFADKVVTTVNEPKSLDVTASNIAGVITFTKKSKGLGCGDINVQFMQDPTDTLVGGVSVAVATATAGTGDPDVTEILDVIGDNHYINIISPYGDSTTLEAVKPYVQTLGDPYNARDSIYITATHGTTSELKILSASIDEKYITVFDTTDWQSDRSFILGHIGREISNSIKKDVNKPLHNIAIPNIVPPVGDSAKGWEDRNSLAGNGIATVDPERLTIEAPVTTEQEITEDKRMENVYNLAELRYSFKTYILQKYGRAKLKKGDERVNADVVVINPVIGAGEAIAWYSGKIQTGQCEDMERFKEELRVTLTDIDTMDWYLPVTLVGQFVVGTGTLSYALGGY